MKGLVYKVFSALLLLSLVTVTSCSDDDDGGKTTTTSGPENIFEMASNDSELSLFAEAIRKTGLSATLINNSDITAFIPTNTIFSSYLLDLGYSDIDAWLTVAKLDVVQQMLSYHILGEKFLEADLATGYVKTKANNDNGFALDIFINSSAGVKLNGDDIGVTGGDIEASNGIIHKINGVLQPQSIGDILQNNDDFFDLKTAAGLADGDILSTLSTPNTSFTMMAPNDGAFNQFYSNRSDISNVVEMANVLGTSALQDALEYHILLGSVRSSNFNTQSYNTRLSGTSQSINTTGGNLSITDGQGRQAFFFFKDITATNGTIHIISNVLLN